MPKLSQTTETNGVETNVVEIKVIIVAALMSEARPLIDYFRLKKQFDSPFTVFSSTQSYVQIVICGMGAVSAATAVGFVGGADNNKSKVWLNIGIAGHRTLEVGSCVRVLSHRFETSNRKQFVSQTVPWRGLLAELITLGEASSHYPENELIDMEGAGFFNAALHFNSSELVQSLKIVSDNAEHSADGLNAQAISKLVLQNRQDIVEFIERMSDFIIEPKPKAKAKPQDDWQALLDWPMSHSQRQIVNEFIQASAALGLYEQAIEIIASATEFKQLDAQLNSLVSAYKPQLL